MHVSTHQQVSDVVKLFNNDIPPDDMLYLDRYDILVKSLEAFFRGQPAENLLYNGDIDEATKDILPICEYLYDMPAMVMRTQRPHIHTHRDHTYTHRPYIATHRPYMSSHQTRVGRVLCRTLLW